MLKGDKNTVNSNVEDVSIASKLICLKYVSKDDSMNV